MDLDAIISELVDKRFDDAVCRAVGDELEGRTRSEGYSLQSKLALHIRKEMDSLIQERSSEIRAFLGRVLDSLILGSSPLGWLRYEINVNPDFMRVRRLYDEEMSRREQEQKEAEARRLEEST